MKVKCIGGLALALGLSLVGTAVGQSTEDPTLQMLANVGTGYNCGRVSTPLNCNGIPVNMGTGTSGNGTFWLDTYLSGYSAGTGFVLFNGVADLGQGTVTSNKVTATNSAGQVTTLLVNFNGPTNDGDNGTYTGTMTLNFSYYYSSGGGGRGGAGAGWRFICTSGTIKITYP